MADRKRICLFFNNIHIIHRKQLNSKPSICRSHVHFVTSENRPQAQQSFKFFEYICLKKHFYLQKCSYLPKCSYSWPNCQINDFVLFRYHYTIQAAPNVVKHSSSIPFFLSTNSSLVILWVKYNVLIRKHSILSASFQGAKFHTLIWSYSKVLDTINVQWSWMNVT